eukprot:scaffold1696_cov258-Pinguiococcus_pyrenoidosus.AAC.28
MSTALAVLVVAGPALGVAMAGASAGIGALLADDVVVVPAVAPWRCELRVQGCQDGRLQAQYGDWRQAVEATDSQYECHQARQALLKGCGADATAVMKYSGPWAAGPVRPDGSWLIQSSGDKAAHQNIALLPTPLRYCPARFGLGIWRFFVRKRRRQGNGCRMDTRVSKRRSAKVS